MNDSNFVHQRNVIYIVKSSTFFFVSYLTKKLERSYSMRNVFVNIVIYKSLT